MAKKNTSNLGIDLEDNGDNDVFLHEAATDDREIRLAEQSSKHRGELIAKYGKSEKPFTKE
jgi:hypothetical protein